MTEPDAASEQPWTPVLVDTFADGIDIVAADFEAHFVSRSIIAGVFEPGQLGSAEGHAAVVLVDDDGRVAVTDGVRPRPGPELDELVSALAVSLGVHASVEGYLVIGPDGSEAADQWKSAAESAASPGSRSVLCFRGDDDIVVGGFATGLERPVQKVRLDGWTLLTASSAVAWPLDAIEALNLPAATLTVLGESFYLTARLPRAGRQRRDSVAVAWEPAARVVTPGLAPGVAALLNPPQRVVVDRPDLLDPAALAALEHLANQPTAEGFGERSAGLLGLPAAAAHWVITGTAPAPVEIVEPSSVWRVALDSVREERPPGVLDRKPWLRVVIVVAEVAWLLVAWLRPGGLPSWMSAIPTWVLWLLALGVVADLAGHCHALWKRRRGTVPTA